jgi:hypothetical protein
MPPPLRPLTPRPKSRLPTTKSCPLAARRTTRPSHWQLHSGPLLRTGRRSRGRDGLAAVSHLTTAGPGGHASPSHRGTSSASVAGADNRSGQGPCGFASPSIIPADMRANARLRVCCDTWAWPRRQSAPCQPSTVPIARARIGEIGTRRRVPLVDREQRRAVRPSPDTRTLGTHALSLTDHAPLGGRPPLGSPAAVRSPIRLRGGAEAS